MATMVVFVNDSSFTDAGGNNLYGHPLKPRSTDKVKFKSTRGAAVTVSFGIVDGVAAGSFSLEPGATSEEFPAPEVDGTLEASNTRGGTMSGGIDVSGGDGDGDSLAAPRLRRPAAPSKKRRAKAKSGGIRAR